MVKISVIVPVYNVEKYLERCLDSLVNQTLKDIEIICVNDGSTDTSADILAKYAEKDERIKIINQTNKGLSEARNRGMLECIGEYTGFVDSDDYVENDFYEKLYNCAANTSSEIACGGIVRENNTQSKILVSYVEEEVTENIKTKFEKAKVPQYCFVWNKIYKTSSLKTNHISFVSGMIYEDLIYTPSVLQKLKKMVVVPGTYYHYWKHPDSLIKNGSDKSRADKLRGYKELIVLCDKYGIKSREKEILLSKRDYNILGIKLLKVYEYRATRKYYLFGLIPFLTVREYV